MHRKSPGLSQLILISVIRSISTGRKSEIGVSEEPLAAHKLTGAKKPPPGLVQRRTHDHQKVIPTVRRNDRTAYSAGAVNRTPVGSRRNGCVLGRGTEAPPPSTLGSSPARSAAPGRWVCRSIGPRMGCQRRPDETILPDREVVPQQSRSMIRFDQTAGFDHVGPHPQRDLSPIPQGRPSRHFEPGSKAMTETVTALAMFFSISVFLAHAFDVYRTR